MKTPRELPMKSLRHFVTRERVSVRGYYFPEKALLIVIEPAAERPLRR